MHNGDEAQGTAGGLGVVKEEKEIEGTTWGERWDDRIRGCSVQVSFLADVAEFISVERLELR